MAKILIVYYSKSGNTEKMAEMVAEGVREEGSVDVELKKVEKTKVSELLDIDGIILGSPTYYGSMAWPVKRFLDESVKHHGKLKGKVGAAFTSSGVLGGGNETTIMDMLKGLLIHGMVIQGDSSGDHYGPVSIGVPDDRSYKNCLKLGKRTAQLVSRLA